MAPGNLAGRDEVGVSPGRKLRKITGKLGSRSPEKKMVICEPSRPLTLLDLPHDILELILKEITNNSDLTSLARTHSVMFDLAIPAIYSSFDIAWPDSINPSSNTPPVDALTSGLSTLCRNTNFSFAAITTGKPGRPARFGGTNHAEHVKTFSIENGPRECLADYFVTKMTNLESFTWDMPTGLLSDTFMALASLSRCPNARPSKLKSVWIRWHDTSGQSYHPWISNHSPIPLLTVQAGSVMTPIGCRPPDHAIYNGSKSPSKYSQSSYEYPTFSILPPLQSLTVLNIEEPAYLDEMATLIERSQATLEELRVGLSSMAYRRDFFMAWDGSTLKQVDHNARWPGECTIGERRLGGVLGVLVGKIYDVRRRSSEMKKHGTRMSGLRTQVPHSATDSSAQQALGSEFPNHQAFEAVSPSASPSASENARSTKLDQEVTGLRDGKLKLRVLELERMALYAFDWSVLKSLTILHCLHQETVWVLLRRQFRPEPISPDVESSLGTSSASPSGLRYKLSLKKIHTDLTTPALIEFIKETLAPDSLETLYLQDTRLNGPPPPVTLPKIFQAIKVHRSSLRALLPDSSGPTSRFDRPRWREWSLTPKTVHYITSGRMVNLRQLSVSLYFSAWHQFLQGLPKTPQLHAIDIPHIAEYVHSRPRPDEVSLYIADILTLRPEVRLRYAGICNTCVEFWEHRRGDTDQRSSVLEVDSPAAPSESLGDNGVNGGFGNNNWGFGNDIDDEGDDESESSTSEEDGDEHEDEESDITDDIVHEGFHMDEDDDHLVHGASSDSEDSDEDDGFCEPEGQVVIRIREIPFPEDKVEIFRARHMKL
ncbi:F-box domain-containing protein-containing protein [Copromyces sp. CBS 386.78]|nr:F-box domain-containing protein-containing protein [Copromyces sp. CBS 386.78]